MIVRHFNEVRNLADAPMSAPKAWESRQFLFLDNGNCKLQITRLFSIWKWTVQKWNWILTFSFQYLKREVENFNILFFKLNMANTKLKMNFNFLFSILKLKQAKNELQHLSFKSRDHDFNPIISMQNAINESLPKLSIKSPSLTWLRNFYYRIRPSDWLLKLWWAPVYQTFHSETWIKLKIMISKLCSWIFTVTNLEEFTQILYSKIVNYKKDPFR